MPEHLLESADSKFPRHFPKIHSLLHWKRHIEGHQFCQWTIFHTNESNACPLLRPCRQRLEALLGFARGARKSSNPSSWRHRPSIGNWLALPQAQWLKVYYLLNSRITVKLKMLSLITHGIVVCQAFKPEWLVDSIHGVSIHSTAFCLDYPVNHGNNVWFIVGSGALVPWEVG